MHSLLRLDNKIRNKQINGSRFALGAERAIPYPIRLHCAIAILHFAPFIDLNGACDWQAQSSHSSCFAFVFHRTKAAKLRGLIGIRLIVCLRIFAHFSRKRFCSDGDFAFAAPECTRRPASIACDTFAFAFISVGTFSIGWRGGERIFVVSNCICGD